MSDGNPDRASRSQGKRPVPASSDNTTLVAVHDVRSDSDDDDDGSLVPASVPASVQADSKTSGVVVAAPAATKQLTLAPAKTTGVSSVTVPLKRTASAQRDHPAWAFVRILQQEGNQITVQCMCGKAFKTSSSTRITDHILGRNSAQKCSGSGPDFDVAKAKLVKHEEKSDVAKKQKQLASASNA